MKHLLTLAATLLLLISCNKEKNSTDTDAPADANDTIVGKAPGVVPDSLRNQLPAPFNTLDFDKAVAYDYGEGYDELPIINKEGKLDGSVVKEKVLDAHETADFLGTLGDPDTYGSGISDCFVPRLGLVLYKGDTVVFYTSICLACNYLDSSMAIPAMMRPRKDPKTGRENFNQGFSDVGHKKLEALCTSFKFSHCNGNPVSQ
jgi:hypothetical protein